MLQRAGDTLFVLRDRIDKLSPPSWREVRDAAGNVAPVDWSRLRTLKGWRDMVRERPGLMLGLCLMVLMSSLLVLQWQSSAPSGPVFSGFRYYYDIGTGKLFTAPDTDVPLVYAPSGASLTDDLPGGVRAMVYACGDCGNPAQRKIAYITTRVPVKTAAKLIPSGSFGNPAATDVALVAAIPSQSPDSPQPTILWHPEGSMEGKSIRASIDKLCGGAAPVPCESP